MANLNATGIYAIINIKSNKIYVGSTGRSFRERWNGHKTRLRRRHHGNHYLQRSWDKHGESAFEFIVLEYVNDPTILVGREQYHFDEIRLICEMYNRGSIVAAPCLGMSPSEETRTRMSKSGKGRKFSKEHKDKIGEAQKGKRNHNYGKHHSEETKHKMRKAQGGKYHHFYGKHHSKKTKIKIGKANAKPYPAFVHRKTGEVIPASVNLSALCRKQKLHISSMCAVIHGQASHHKDWTLHKVTTSLRIDGMAIAL